MKRLIRPARVENLRRAGKVILPLTALLLLAGVALASNGYEIIPQVFGGGGGHSEAGGYALDASVGQAVAGVTSSGAYELCSGFWCGLGGYRVFLPVVMR
jgi:hypothetical protein